MFANVNGIIKKVFVVEGDSIKKGQTILSISNAPQLLNKENAELAANFANINSNQDKLYQSEIIFNPICHFDDRRNLFIKILPASG